MVFLLYFILLPHACPFWFFSYAIFYGYIIIHIEFLFEILNGMNETFIYVPLKLMRFCLQS